MTLETIREVPVGLWFALGGALAFGIVYDRPLGTATWLSSRQRAAARILSTWVSPMERHCVLSGVCPGHVRKNKGLLVALP